MLSAEAPEFIPRVSNIGSVATNNPSQQSFHRNQQSAQMINHNTYRNQNHGLSTHFTVICFFYIQLK